jgi:hypothetical protein
MKIKNLAAASFALLTLGGGVAAGAPVTVGFAFHASGFVGFVGTVPPMDPVSGSVTFTYDDAIAGYPNLQPDTVDLTIAGFTYENTDVAVYIDPHVFVIGGVLGGGPLGMGSPSNDFRLIFDRSSPARYFDYSVSFRNDIYSASSLQVTSIPPRIPIPEPGSLALFASGAVAWWAAGGARRLRTH